MSTKQERRDEAVNELENTFSTNARGVKIEKIVNAIGASQSASLIFDELVEHQLTDVAWAMIDRIAGVNPSSAVTRECVRQVVIFNTFNEAPVTLRQRFKSFIGL